MPSSQMGHAGALPLQSNLLQLAENRLHLLRGDVASGVVDDVFQRDGAGHRQHGVPHTMAELTSLPGVGRKTANIVLNVSFGIVEGIAVDTHVNRIAHRLELSPKTHEREPLKTEQDLLAILPRELWGPVNHQWIRHGRDTCTARAPKCDGCVLEDICPSAHRL